MAQSTGKVWRLGIVRPGLPLDPYVEVFRRALGDLGYREGRNLAIEFRWAHGRAERLPQRAAELAQLRVDAILVAGTAATRAAQRAQNLILSGINVLILIHENKFEAPLTVGSQVGGFSSGPEEPKRILFEVVEIDSTEGAFGGFETAGKFLSQIEQSAEAGGAPLPILKQRVLSASLQERIEKVDILEKFRWPKRSLFSFPIALVDLPDLFESRPQLLLGLAAWQFRKNIDASSQIRTLGGIVLKQRGPRTAQVFDSIKKPADPQFAIWLLQLCTLASEPCFGIRTRLRILMYLADQFTNFSIATVPQQADELHRLLCARLGPLISVVKNRVKCFLLEQARLLLGENAQLRVEFQLIKMLSHQLIAETVKGADRRLVQQRELLGKDGIAWPLMLLPLQTLADAAAHFCGGGFCKRDHQHLVQIGFALQHLLNATLHQCASLAGSSARDEQDVSVRPNGFRLFWRKGSQLSPFIDHALTSFLRLRKGCVHGSIRQIEAW